MSHPTSDSDLLASISASHDFKELPVSFAQIDPKAIHGIRFDFLTPICHSDYVILRGNVSSEEWSNAMNDARNHSGIEHIDAQNHFSPVAFLNEDGKWVTTLEGDFINSL